MRLKIGSILAFALVAGAAFPAADVTSQRRALMKANGDASKIMVTILRGAPYNASAVQTAMKTYEDTAAKMPALFPPSSKTGGETAALPEIWTNKADFEARFAKFGKDAAAAALSIKDAETFKAVMPTVLADCKGCHELYRAKQN